MPCFIHLSSKKRWGRLQQFLPRFQSIVLNSGIAFKHENIRRLYILIGFNGFLERVFFGKPSGLFQVCAEFFWVPEFFQWDRCQRPMEKSVFGSSKCWSMLVRRQDSVFMFWSANLWDHKMLSMKLGLEISPLPPQSRSFPILTIPCWPLQGF